MDDERRFGAGRRLRDYAPLPAARTNVAMMFSRSSTQIRHRAVVSAFNRHKPGLSGPRVLAWPTLGLMLLTSCGRTSLLGRRNDASVEDVARGSLRDAVPDEASGGAGGAGGSSGASGSGGVSGGASGASGW